jgi:hypothetical protein
MTVIASDHTRLDERSLALHRLVARKLLADPAVLHQARDNLRRWQATNGATVPALAEWGLILDGPSAKVARLLTERSERATRLRQSSPFAGVLTEAERRAVYESFTIGTYHPGREPGCE